MADSKSKDIKNALVALLQGLQRDGEPAFQEVKGHPRGTYEGFPAARVQPGDQTTSKGAHGQNDRTVNLTIRVLVEATDTGAEFDQMYELTDLVLDALDTADYQGDFIESLDAEELNASRGDWFDMNSQSTGPLLACDITVGVEYSRDN